MMSNTSNDSLEENDGQPPAASMVAASVCASLLALVTYSLEISSIITAFNRDKKLRRNYTNSFLVSLACADLLVGVVVIPFYTTLNFINNGNWYHGNASCYVFLGT